MASVRKRAGASWPMYYTIPSQPSVLVHISKSVDRIYTYVAPHEEWIPPRGSTGAYIRMDTFVLAHRRTQTIVRAREVWIPSCGRIGYIYVCVSIRTKPEKS